MRRIIKNADIRSDVMSGPAADKRFSSDGKVLAQMNDDTLNKVYPVGSVYMSTTSVSPAKRFGGNWTLITDGFQITPDVTCSVWKRTK